MRSNITILLLVYSTRCGDSSYGEKMPTVNDKDATKFRRAAKKFTDAATKSEELAKETLEKLGIYTKSGNLSTRYK